MHWLGVCLTVTTPYQFSGGLIQSLGFSSLQIKTHNLISLTVGVSVTISIVTTGRVSPRAPHQLCHSKTWIAYSLQKNVFISTDFSHPCYLKLTKASTTSDLDLCLPASPEFTGSWNDMPHPLMVITLKLYPFHISHLFLNVKWNLPHLNLNFSTLLKQHHFSPKNQQIK